MSKKPTKAATMPASARPAGLNAGHKILFLLAGVAILPLSLPTLTLLFFGMLPTMAAGLIDRGPHRYAWLCVGGLNFAGLTPYLFELWMRGHTLDRAFELLTSVVTLLVAFGAAAFGWMLYMVMPPVVGAFLQVAAQRRVQVLRGNQKKLIELWGPDVSKAETE